MHVIAGCVDTARRAIAPLEWSEEGPVVPDQGVHGLTDGSWSFCDAILAILEHVSPVRLTISTWTAAKADLTSIHRLLRSGKVEDLT